MTKLLNKIESPADIKKLSVKELERLAQEIRQLIISTVADTGGHLASNLGVVELTLALYKSFNFPQDKLVWDVGHQCYTHKIITGRKDKFATLRQQDGISGFPRRTESKYDAFGVGHASTSLSAALGMAKARDLKQKKEKIVAVIGDGSLTGGLALEGLNQIGTAQSDLIVVLNDNKMSISENVGAVASYLNKIISDPRVIKTRDKARDLVRKLPNRLGRLALRTGELVEGGVKSIIAPGAWFEELGFRYFGPLDGHDPAELTQTFRNIKNVKGPILLHVITQKGKGYKHAEKNASKFHGAAPFDVKNGQSKTKKTQPNQTYTQVFSSTLLKLADSNKDIVAITAAMPEGTGLDKFKEKYPRRFFDVGIAEEHAVTFAAGLATQGCRPVVAIYSTFLQRAYDQIIHDVALQKLPVIFVLDRAGLVGDDGATHHGAFDISYLRHIPNMVVMAPKDENELQRMLKTAEQYKEGPLAIRYPKGEGLGVELAREIKPLPIGGGETLREGKDINIIALGSMVAVAEQAAEKLASEGIEAAVINTRFIKPLDKEMILSAARCGKIVTVEENVLAGGLGSAVLELLEENNLSNVKVKRLGLPDKFIEHGKNELLKDEIGLNIAGVCKSCRELLK
ncbi:MAG: 1-deoxy-D-xylulose-5-phosphate synthase [Parcubacteria group bacterium]